MVKAGPNRKHAHNGTCVSQGYWSARRYWKPLFPREIPLYHKVHNTGRRNFRPTPVGFIQQPATDDNKKNKNHREAAKNPFNIAYDRWWCNRWGMKAILALITVLLLGACVADGTQSVDPVTGKVLKEKYK